MIVTAKEYSKFSWSKLTLVIRTSMHTENAHDKVGDLQCVHTLNNHGNGWFDVDGVTIHGRAELTATIQKQIGQNNGTFLDDKTSDTFDIDDDIYNNTILINRIKELA